MIIECKCGLKVNVTNLPTNWKNDGTRTKQCAFCGKVLLSLGTIKIKGENNV